jgi:ribosomal protein S18 acetylase RimI-like enzyme
MNELMTTSATGLLAVNARREVSIRVATMADLPFLDALQKQFGRALGYFPTKQFEGYIEMGAVLVARAPGECMGETPMPLGYVISRDRYLKRDELGVIYQLCVAPGHQRGLIGATLLKEVFARSAYGCKLYCCWCAQDLSANHFWESMGFVPIAFRAGSTGKRRVHIFWQRRINDGDTAAPYWYPSMTNQGAIREDRLVFPIPPGTHWSEFQAIALPTAASGIVAVDDGGTWAGADELELPFP